jgi:hypothetical protein
MPPKAKATKIKILKAPKKPKRPILKSKGRISSLLDLDNVFEKENLKRLQIQINNQYAKQDSDYESESESETSDSDDNFKPTLTLGNRNIERCKKEKLEFNGIDIAKIPTNKDCIPERYLMTQGIIPKGYSNMMIVNGSINSGKTNAIISMLLNPLIYGRDATGKTFQDNLYIFSGSDDDAYDILIQQKILRPENIKRQPTSKDLKKVLDMIKEQIKANDENLGRMPVSIIIFDDIINNNEFIKSKEFKACAIHPRQYFIFSIILSQFFNTIPRIVRMQAQNLMLFQGNATEVEIYSDTYCPSTMKKRDFALILNTAWEKTEDNKHPFLHIARKQPIETRFRRNFDTIIDINKE